MATQTHSISPAQRAQNFSAATRQNFHMLPTQTITGMSGQTVQFTYPKSRLLSKTFVLFDILLNVENSNNAVNYLNETSDPYRPYDLVRRISLSLNNGFDPFVTSGRHLAIMNSVRNNPKYVFNYIDGSLGSVFLDDLGSGKVKVKFMLELENTLNQRDCSGLILLQNESTQVTLSVDMATNLSDLGATESPYEYVKISPMIQTYTIPNYAEAFPDLSILKLVKGRTESFNMGEHILKLDVGTIYRKLVLYITDNDNEPISTDVIPSNFELLYNTADTPISISAEMLRAKNASDFGTVLPEGMFVFDFSGYSGFSNYGGSRDFVDTERLSEFWVRFSTNDNIKVHIVQENLSRLK